LGGSVALRAEGAPVPAEERDFRERGQVAELRAESDPDAFAVRIELADLIAVDVGYGQLALPLRDDPRVVVLERTNARELLELPFAPQLIVCDVSFISVRKALPPALRLAAPGWQALVLVKPQFEAGRAEVGKGGVVRDREIHRRVLRATADAALEWGAQTVGAVDSGLPGPKGNREFFLHLVERDRPHSDDDLDTWISDAIS
jgi:23S rRNA (cytidine1920-2'-O)/16S rRNA (cytidine1409-2'-O)-methyltransferase